jgi:hypothetical protein
LVQDVFIGADQFSFPVVRKLCDAVLTGNQGVGFIKYRVFGDEASAKPLPKPDHENYAHWRRFYDRMASSPIRVGEMIAIEGNAVLRYRSPADGIRRQLLRGRDPLLIELRGSTFEILEIAIASSPWRRGDTKLQSFAFLQNEGLLAGKAGEEAFDFLQKHLYIPLAGLYARNDSWFIENAHFPIVYQYARPGSVPSADEYARTSTLFCAKEGAAVSCTLLSGGETRRPR